MTITSQLFSRLPPIFLSSSSSSPTRSITPPSTSAPLLLFFGLASSHDSEAPSSLPRSLLFLFSDDLAARSSANERKDAFIARMNLRERRCHYSRAKIVLSTSPCLSRHCVLLLSSVPTFSASIQDAALGMWSSSSGFAASGKELFS